MSPKSFLSKAYKVKTGSETAAFYRNWAATYDEELQHQGYAQPHRCAEALLEQLDDRNAPIIDLGCGTGLSGAALSQAGYAHIDGCDFSSEMLEKANRRDVYNRLFRANLNTPPIVEDAETYRAALAVGVFSYGHVSPDAIDEILRILKPGGPLIIGVNAHFYDEGSLCAKVDALAAENRLVVLAWEHGDHIPGAGIEGWVLKAAKAV